MNTQTETATDIGNDDAVSASNSTDLLPCPFCGGKPYVTERDIGSRNLHWLIICIPCRVKMTVYREDKIGATQAWNTRAG